MRMYKLKKTILRILGIVIVVAFWVIFLTPLLLIRIIQLLIIEFTPDKEDFFDKWKRISKKYYKY